MLGKFIGRGGEPRRKKDKAIIHESVPDEVLYPDGKSPDTVDTSWMNDVLPQSESAPAAPAVAEPARAKPDIAPAPRPVSRPRTGQKPAQPAAVEVTSFPDAPVNAAAVARPRYPVGWLVVVEGPGTGNWFPLEGGVSSLGWSDDRTIRLPDPMTSDAGQHAAAVAYDKNANAFSVKALSGEVVRLNGVEQKGPARLRDGDVFSFGGMALRLVALCGGNFRWTDAESV